MAENTKEAQGRRSIKIGEVVSNKMDKTIVVEVTRQYPHPLYRRVMSRSKRFYAHDQGNTANVGDFVEIEETRPMSRLKRWRLKNIVRRAALVPGAPLSKAEAAEKQEKAS